MQFFIPFVNNVPYSGTERSLMNFQYQKRFKRVKTIRLSTHNDIFEEKKFQFFFGVVGKKIKIFFSIYDKKSAENFILGIHLVEKCLIREKYVT